jgi:hypothetical protein
MDADEIRQVVDAIVNRKRLSELRPHDLVASLHRRSLPATFLPIIEPLLHIRSDATYKYAMDIVGKMKGASDEASDAVQAAW